MSAPTTRAPRMQHVSTQLETTLVLVTAVIVEMRTHHRVARVEHTCYTFAHTLHMRAQTARLQINT